MNECQSCKDYRKCPFKGDKAWFHYGEVRWCPYQIIFIIQNVETLREGNWPENPNGSTYTDPSIRTGFRDEAYYTKPSEVLAEFEARMKSLKDAGDALIDEVNKGWGIEQLSRPAYRALMYLKGLRRKRQSFAGWSRDWGKTHKKDDFSVEKVA